MTGAGATKQDLAFYDPDLEDEEEDDLEDEEEDHQLDQSGEISNPLRFSFFRFTV